MIKLYFVLRYIPTITPNPTTECHQEGSNGGKRLLLIETHPWFQWLLSTSMCHVSQNAWVALIHVKFVDSQLPMPLCHATHRLFFFTGRGLFYLYQGAMWVSCLLRLSCLIRGVLSLILQSWHFVLARTKKMYGLCCFTCKNHIYIYIHLQRKPKVIRLGK